MERVMNVDELRDAIWERLFRSKAPESVQAIATHMNRNTADVEAAVNHEWFTVSNGFAAIAYAASATNVEK